MDEEIVIVKGNTLERAVEKGAQKLGVSSSKVSYEILVEGRKGMFGTKGRPYELYVFLADEEKKQRDEMLAKLANELPVDTDTIISEDTALNGYCTIEAREDGVFLTVHPPIGAGEKLSLEKATAVIGDKGVTDVDFSEVERACELSHEVPVKIADFKPETYPEVNVVITVDKDGMTAFMTLEGTEFNRMPSLDQVINIIKDAGVVTGIDEERISDLVELNILNRRASIAQGTPPSPGQDAYLNYRFKPPGEHHQLSQGEGEKVDHRNLGTVQNITKGEPMAEKVPASEGKDGCTVTGDVLKAPGGKDIAMPRGSHTRISDDGLTLIADIDGHVKFVGSTPQIVPVFDVKGDVDYSVGNIDFLGDVHIKGKVLDDFKVKARGSIHVGGNVQSAVLEAGHSIVIKGGVIGKNKGLVKAKETVSAKFAENANISAGEDVVITKAILHSKVSAGHSVTVTGGKAVIIGGQIIAGTAVESKTIGSYVDVKTLIQVGINPVLIEEYNTIDEELNQYERSLVEINRSIEHVVQKQDVKKLPPDKYKLLHKWLSMRKTLTISINQMVTRCEELADQAMTTTSGRIKVSGVIFPGVVLNIGAATRKITEEIRHSSFSNHNGDIRIAPY